MSNVHVQHLLPNGGHNPSVLKVFDNYEDIDQQALNKQQPKQHHHHQ
jgi:hypothetical protein